MSTRVLGVAGYTTFSATLLLLNKMAIHHLQAPTFILTLQLMASAAAVSCAGAVGLCEVDPLEWGKMKSFGTCSVTFLALIWTNIKTLQVLLPM